MDVKDNSTSVTDADYFIRRAREERNRIRHAATDRARRIHIEMADHYEAVARALAKTRTIPSWSWRLRRAVRRWLTRW